jgi:hypothetical protein
MYFIILPFSTQVILKLFINQALKCKYQLSHLKVNLHLNSTLKTQLKKSDIKYQILRSVVNLGTSGTPRAHLHDVVSTVFLQYVMTVHNLSSSSQLTLDSQIASAVDKYNIKPTH